MNAGKSGAFFVKKKDGILRSTATGEKVDQESLIALADAAGFSIVKEVVKVRERRVKVEVPVERDLVSEAIDAMPSPVKVIARNCFNASSMNEGIKEMTGRWKEFRSVEAAIFAGIAMEPSAREFFSGCLDEAWNRNVIPRETQPEVVIGGGLHAAIYCAMRVAKGFPPPLVLEQEDRAGGVFAVSKRPSFYLNSRNRPGELSVPGEKDGTLNYLPGAVLQPSDICSNEYITNEAMAWVIRLTLALNAKVVVGTRVEEATNAVYSSSRQARGCSVRTERGRVFGGRVIFAPGLGKPNRCLDDPRLLDFEQFMARMDDPFPLRGARRVAIIGTGDSAKTVAEALVGLGPAAGMSVAALDWPTKITWFGIEESMTCELWLQQNRTRYSGLAGSMPRTAVPGETPARIEGRGKVNTETIKPGYNCILIGEKPYDLVIDCTGITRETKAQPSWSQYTKAGRVVAYKDTSSDRFLVGPALDMAVTSNEQVLLKGISENSTSLFRYAGRTAQLAEVLA